MAPTKAEMTITITIKRGDTEYSSTLRLEEAEIYNRVYASESPAVCAALENVAWRAFEKERTAAFERLKAELP